MSKRLLKVVEFARITDTSLQRAYEILRQNPELVVKLGQRQLRVDPDRLNEWIKRGGTSDGIETGVTQ